VRRAAQHKARVVRPAAPPAPDGYCETVLRIYNRADNFDGLLWACGPGGIRFFARCPNLFRWADEDAELIGPHDIELLEQCLADLGPWTGFLSELFTVRKRGARPLWMWLAENPNVADIFEKAVRPDSTEHDDQV